MRTKPKTQERRNWEVNRGSDQPPNSREEILEFLKTIK